jgi:hypothetical protein
VDGTTGLDFVDHSSKFEKQVQAKLMVRRETAIFQKEIPGTRHQIILWRCGNVVWLVFMLF